MKDAFKLTFLGTTLIVFFLLLILATPKIVSSTVLFVLAVIVLLMLGYTAGLAIQEVTLAIQEEYYLWKIKRLEKKRNKTK